MTTRNTFKLSKLLLSLGVLTASSQLVAQDLIWSDEFEGDKIDRSIWSYNVGGSGNGNGELDRKSVV